MKTELVSYETAITLKAKGLDQELDEGNWYYVTMRDDSKRAFCWTSQEDKPYDMMNPILAPTHHEDLMRISAMAMQGILANGQTQSNKFVAIESIELAKELMKQLKLEQK